MPDSMPRIPIAEPGDVPPKADRQLHFWFWYDWDTTNKVIGLSPDRPPPTEGEWQRLYQCSMHLPPPIEHDGRTEIECEATAYGGQDYDSPQEELAHWIARRLFCLAPQTAPSPTGSHWLGNPFDKANASFEMLTKGHRFRVTVEHLGPNHAVPRDRQPQDGTGA